LECTNTYHVEIAQMRMFIGIILGSALTLGGLYIADSVSSGDAARPPMVNWDVVGKNVNNVVGMAKEGWKKIGG
jgi:hypothetical protein